MIKDTYNKKNRAYGSILGLVFLAFLIFGLFSTFSVKTAEASNNYVDNVYIWLDEQGFWRLHFRVETTFSITYTSTGTCSYGEKTPPRSQTNFSKGYLGADSYGANPTDRWHAWFNEAFPYQAGITYDIYLTRVGYWGTGQLSGRRIGDLCYCAESDYNCSYKLNYLLNKKGGSAYFNPPENYTFRLTSFGNVQVNDAEEYPVKTFPTLTITYPSVNDEIAEAFNIQGSYSIPEGSNYQYLTAYLRAPFGTPTPFYVYSFKQDLTATSGVVNIRVSGVPIGEYWIFFFFSGSGEESYNPHKDIETIFIVENIPYEMPYTQEVPPESFNPLEPEYVYSQYSNYATSTQLYNTFTGALKPLISVIGNNLTFFSSQFNQTDAKTSGQEAGQAVLIVRAYAGNLNSFFNGLPIAEVLFLYLMALVIVIVFRIIRLLLKLIPFT